MKAFPTIADALSSGSWSAWSIGSIPPDLMMADSSPRDVRAAIGWLFAGSVSSEALADVVLAATELTTNALVHGTPPSEVLVWKDGAGCVVQVHDSGTTPIDAYADLRPCVGGAHGGFGLWTVGQLADAVHITHDERGNTVTALVVAGQR